MSYNGSGTFNINTAGQPVVTGTVISSTAFNALTADLATGLSTAITKNGQTTVTANIPFNNFKLTGVGVATATGDALSYGQAATVTSLVASTSITDSGLTSGRVTYASTGGLLADSASLTWDGTTLAATKFSGALNGTVGATTPSTGAFTTLDASGNVTLSGGTANGVAYLNGSKVLTTGSALTFDGTTLAATKFSGAFNGTVGATTPSTGAFTTLSSTGDITLIGSRTINTSTGYLQLKSTSGVVFVDAATTFSMYAGGVNSATLSSTGLAVTGTLSATDNISSSTSTGGAYSVKVSGTQKAAITTHASITGSGADYTPSYFSETGLGAYWMVNGSTTKVMTLDASGRLGIGATPSSQWGTSSDSQVLQLSTQGYLWARSSDGAAFVGYNGAYNGTSDVYIGNGYASNIYFAGGNIVTRTAANNTSGAGAAVSWTSGPSLANQGTSWTNASDENLKNITGLITNAVEALQTLRAARFTWKTDSTNKPQVGLIAQDVQKVFPEVVVEIDNLDGTSHLGVNYTEVIPILVAAIQEQQAIITALTTRITALEAK